MLKAHIDFEGGAPGDLKKLGLHRWLEHPAVQCWCLSWRLGSFGPVHRWYPGDPDPVALLDHVRAGGIVVAHNAAFERHFWNTIIRRKYAPHWPALRLEQQDCTLARCSALSLPAGLDDAGYILGTAHQKDKGGAALMLKMARPRAVEQCIYCAGDGCADCQGTGETYVWWNEPANLARLGTYCDGDVEAETDIDEKVMPLSAREHRVWLLDQIINDRGIRLDIPLIKRAQALVEHAKKRLDHQIFELTDRQITKATLVAKIKAWITQQGVPVTSLAKGQQEEIIALADVFDAPKVEEIIAIRRQAARSSTAKLARMLACVGAGDSAYGQLFYHGAHCVPGDVEVLTPDGWARFDVWTGGPIAQVHRGGNVEFLPAERYSGPVVDEWVRVEAPHLTCDFTPGHTVPYLLDGSRAWHTLQAGALLDRSRVTVPTTGTLTTDGALDRWEMRALAMVQADGNWTEKNGRVIALRLKFRKRRKIDRARLLLSINDILFTENKQTTGDVCFYVPLRHCPSWLTPDRKTFGPWLLDSTRHGRAAFIDELQYWDGRKKDGAVVFATAAPVNVEWVCILAHLTGASTTTNVWWDYRSNTNNYDVRISSRDCATIKQEHRRLVRTPQRAFCAETQTGFFLVRSKGRVFVTGNTGRWAGRLIQFQNLYRTDEERDGKDIEIALEILQAPISIEEAHDRMETILGEPMTQLAKCMRSMIIAREGKKLVGADLSNIEGCANAWSSGEEWKVQAYRDYQAGIGPDLYRVAYGRSFGVDPADVTSAQRQLGKVEELALGYQGSVGAFYTFTQTMMMKLGPIVATVRATASREQWDKAEWLFTKMPAPKKYGLPLDVWAAMRIVVDGWRAAHPAHVASWRDLEDSAIEAMSTPTIVVPCLDGKVKYMASNGFLWCQLPSGRVIAYPKAQLKWRDNSTITLPDGTVEEAKNYTPAEIERLIGEGAEYKQRIRRVVTYEGFDKDAGWQVRTLYGGLQSENVNSGIARDILVDCMFDAEEAGYPVILTIHDELLTEVLQGFGSAAELQGVMSRPRAWCPGFPLSAKGWEGVRYGK